MYIGSLNRVVITEPSRYHWTISLSLNRLVITRYHRYHRLVIRAISIFEGYWIEWLLLHVRGKLYAGTNINALLDLACVSTGTKRDVRSCQRVYRHKARRPILPACLPAQSEASDPASVSTGTKRGARSCQLVYLHKERRSVLPACLPAKERRSVLSACLPAPREALGPASLSTGTKRGALSCTNCRDNIWVTVLLDKTLNSSVTSIDRIE